MRKRYLFASGMLLLLTAVPRGHLYAQTPVALALQQDQAAAPPASGTAVADIPVSGRITGEDGGGLPGVTVLVKGTTNGTATDADGRFKLTAPDNGTLVISFIGYTTQEVPIAGKSTIDVKLTADVESLSEVVVVGYGEQKKATVTGSVAQVKGTELQKSPAVNISNSIAGRMPGVIATNRSGEPGYDGSTIRIRGSNTLGNNDALIVIDGVPARAGGFDRLNPADIESISVLKDASAAIYGSRAANGVILITTKRGKDGKPSLSYTYNQGWAQPTIVPKLASASQYAELVNEIDLYNLPAEYWTAASQAFRETGTFTRPDNGAVTNATFKPDDLRKFQDGSNPWTHPNTDWFAATLKPWSPQSRHNLQLSGGSENVKYLASLGYQNQDAFYRNAATGYKQYDLRLNLDATVNKFISTSLGVVGRQENRFFPTRPAGSIFRMLMRGYPYRPAYWPNGLPGPDIENGEQPVVISTNDTGYDRDTRYYLQSNGTINITNPWVKGLKLTGTAAVDKYLRQTKNFATPWFVYSWDNTTFEEDGVTPKLQEVKRGPDQAQLAQGTEDQLNVLLSGILSYERTLGSHGITLLAGITRETANNSNFGASRRYFSSTAIDQLFAGGNREQFAGGSAWERARLSYFGRAAYNFREKYLAEFLWRYDASYMFPRTSRWGFFPGISVGYRISEENFFKDNVKFVSSLKLRGSLGQLGNDNVEFNNTLREYDYLATYLYGSYPINGQLAQTLLENGVPNTNLTWEVANNANLGLDGALLNGKIFFEFDVFSNKRSNILWRRSASIPQTTGMVLPAENIGVVRNRGWEFNVGYNGQVGDLTYNASVNGGYAKNKIEFWDETPGAPEWQRSTGRTINSNLYYIYEGIFATQADIDANISPVTGKPVDYSGVGASTLRPGDMRFKDYNNDGLINGDDRVRRDKNTQPTFQGGLNLGAGYKGFDLAVLFQGAAGGELFLQTESGTIGNFLEYSYRNRWTVDNPSTEHPRTVDRNNQYFSNGNTYWLVNTDYVRLKNVEIGYTLPERLTSRVGIGNLRLYVNGLNLITWDKTDVFDPESLNGNVQYYPQSRILNTGLSVTF
ncbi:MAG: Outer membrane TonB-dependent transporter, utilization system for glycans and polysaccharides (PUL), SusC family [uncultured Cytophagales bacterium]|uniref:Outer membrane TonB-dependent transporter, utilization system for glycans and polysaccharides (PUL), SusC family n=1 Tax=uncultured Cytophagales bacterium TaxID=158755 RepID=A0A6J4IJ49_9SPHI|nr:MAG: Outer membrane TonB-dependent transporter, utilization system for glycans and polysaccharides (PUL), SusC family [uncultured Cytophagales bacterium]